MGPTQGQFQGQFGSAVPRVSRVTRRLRSGWPFDTAVNESSHPISTAIAEMLTTDLWKPGTRDKGARAVDRGIGHDSGPEAYGVSRRLRSTEGCAPIVSTTARQT